MARGKECQRGSTTSALVGVTIYQQVAINEEKYHNPRMHSIQRNCSGCTHSVT